MADALALKSDEGRSIAAISVGEVQSNLWSDDFRMGKPYQVNPDNFRCNSSDVRTLGSKTFQYQEEKRTIVIPWVAASETGSAQTQPQNRTMSESSYADFGYGGYKATANI